MLYMKGGKLSKAVEMCFAAQLFDVLQHIADDLSKGADPALYARLVPSTPVLPVLVAGMPCTCVELHST